MRNPDLETDACESPQPTRGTPPYLPSSPWNDMANIDLLEFKLTELRALANAMYCVALVSEKDEFHHFLFCQKTRTTPNAMEELGPLNLLSQRLCDEVECHINALNQGRTEENRKRLDPEGQALLDELAHILSVATPAEREMLALGIEGVKQKAQQKKASHNSPQQGKTKLNGQGKG